MGYPSRKFYPKKTAKASKTNFNAQVFSFQKKPTSFSVCGSQFNVAANMIKKLI
jgi:hypothetical protein